ncbi:hypothetical protein [Adhaeribacter arboris]|nr:hypothetical protein [Adhaeribacter arboris]
MRKGSLDRPERAKRGPPAFEANWLRLKEDSTNDGNGNQLQR